MNFTNRFTSVFPGDETGSKESRITPNVLWSLVNPEPVPKPELLILSDEVRSFCGLNSMDDQTLTEVFSGNRLIPGMKPYSSRYGGHQFGRWAGQLGDGRAITLGEICTDQNEYFELQLKGAGRTPYSRSGDGKAVLRSSLREFLCSEAVHYLGIPTTRALCCITTGESVIRDLFYDGNPKPEPGAITTRVAPSFIRFGNFQILAAHGETENLKKLIQFTIKNYYPNIAADSEDGIIEWFQSVTEKTARLIVEWMRVGFVHGVMNTDNMSILGLTIDYGPYGWLDVYEPDWTPNTTDAENRRYRFESQPSIALWNLVRLAESIALILSKTKISKLQDILNDYGTLYQKIHFQMMCNKLGIDGKQKDDPKLVKNLDSALRAQEIDMTLFFRRLSDLKSPEIEPFETQLEPALYSDSKKISENLTNWLSAYLIRIQNDSLTQSARKKIMGQSNPVFVLRNYLVQTALDELNDGKQNYLNRLFQALKDPYTENPNYAEFYQKRPEWARTRAGCSALSCSS